MKTHLRKLTTLILCSAALAGTASAQQLVVRGEVGFAAAGKGTYDEAGFSGNISIGSTLDAAGHHELSLGLGAIAWAEPDVRGYRPDDGRGITTVKIDGDYYDLPTTSEHFTIDNQDLVLANGTRVDAGYRPSLAIVPIMAHYRFNFGQADSRIRFFVGVGAGYARMRMESELWKEFKRNTHAKTQSDTASGFTWSGTAGVSVKVFKRLKAEASYAFQSVEGAEFRMANIACKLDRMDIHQFRGGLSWAF